MEVRFDDIDARSKIFQKLETQNISFHWDCAPNKYYTILMYDIDVPELTTTLIHFLEINIPGIHTGQELLEYKRPNPPDKVHRYIIDLFEQNGVIQSFNVDRKTDPKMIESIKKLKLIDQVIVKVKP